MPSQAACLQNLGLGRLGQAAWLGLAWLAFFEADSSRVKPSQAETSRVKPSGLAWLGLACLFRGGFKPSQAETQA